MSDTAIFVEKVSKRYVISHNATGDDGLRHKLEDAFRTPWRWLKGQRSRAQARAEEFWALQSVSFEVRTGEVLGIVGRNGAGKSTILKILSRISEPTSGRVRIRGRVASLLEVGTGFHPELTGKENIFLNGAILGMSRSEIRRKFDEIVAFSQIERFLDTPVKRYSSGMYVRLAFAVAAHLDPEILIVDEVLAVGDAEFQKKCLGRMSDVARSGRTVLMVSHNMQAVARLCSRCLLLHAGQVQMDGPANEVCSAYLGGGSQLAAVREWPSTAPGDDVVRLLAVRVVSPDGRPTDTVDIRSEFGIQLEFDVLTPGHLLLPNFDLYNEAGVRLFLTLDLDPAWRGKPRPPGRYVSTGWIPGNYLNEGLISVGPAIMSLKPDRLHLEVADAVIFRVVDSLQAQDTSRGDYPKPVPGLMRPALKWSTRFSESARGVENARLDE